MGTLTAQILIGDAHTYHDGIIPSHYLFLSENSRPAWILVGQNVFDQTPMDKGKVVWIPTLEHMLEDALLMIAVNVLKEQNILSIAKNIFKNIDSNRVELYEIDESNRNKLYQECQKIKYPCKLIVSVFYGSSITKQVSVLKNYQVETEVCLSDRLKS